MSIMPTSYSLEYTFEPAIELPPDQPHVTFDFKNDDVFIAVYPTQIALIFTNIFPDDARSYASRVFEWLNTGVEEMHIFTFCQLVFLSGAFHAMLIPEHLQDRWYLTRRVPITLDDGITTTIVTQTQYGWSWVRQQNDPVHLCPDELERSIDRAIPDFPWPTDAEIDTDSGSENEEI